MHTLIRMINLFKQIGYLFFALTICLSCNNGNKNSDTSRDTIGTQGTIKSSEKATTSISDQDAQEKLVKQELIKIKLRKELFKSFYDNGEAVKLKFVVATPGWSGKIKLFTCAIKSDGEMSGKPFLLKDGNEDDDPGDRIIFLPGWSLFKTDFDEYRNKQPGRVLPYKDIYLHPKTTTEGSELMVNGKAYTTKYVTYEVYFDDENTGITLNPSPPGIISYDKKTKK